jgi:hypothetical protein
MKTISLSFKWRLLLLCTVITCNSFGQIDFRLPYSVPFSTPSWILDMDAGDLNRDGLPDIVASYRDKKKISVLYNNPLQPGTFAGARDYALPLISDIAIIYDLKIADVNNDQWPDIIAGEANDLHLHVMLADGNGSFLPAKKYYLGTYGSSLAITDLNHDNRLDIAICDGFNVGMVLQDPFTPGQFTAYKQVWAAWPGFSADDLTTTDINLDGYTDIIVCNGSPDSVARLAVLTANKWDPGGFLEPVVYEAGRNPYSWRGGLISFIDNGYPTVAMSTGNDHHFAVFNNTPGSPGTLQKPVQNESVNLRQYIAAGEFYHANNKKSLEIITVSTNSNIISFFTAGATPGSYTRVHRMPIQRPEDIYVRDFDSDGADDLLVMGEFGPRIYYRDIPAVQFITPVNGEIVESSVPYTIKWQLYKTDSLRIRYSIDNQLNWVVVHEGKTRQGDSLQMFIPSNQGKNLYFEISTMDGSAKKIVQTNIQIDSLTVLSPNGGETLAPGSDITVSWKTNSQKRFGVTMLTNGTNYYPVAQDLPAGTKSVNWRVPADVKSPNQCRILIYSLLNNAFSDQSDTTFTILPKIQLVTPNGSERIYGGTNYTITWKNTHNKNYSAWYSTQDYNYNWVPIFTNIPPSVTSYNWLAPHVTSTKCRILIMTTDSSMSDMSDANFTMVSGASIISPNGGEVLQGGSTVKVTWTGGLATFNGWYTIDNGATWNTLFTGKYGFLGYTWTIPLNINSSQCRIRVTSTTDNLVTDESDANFSIQSGASARMGATAATSSKQVFDLQLYPNPTSNELTVLLPTGATNRVLTVYNVQGVAVLRQTVAAGTGKLTIPVKQFSKGHYFVELKTGGSIHRKPFIKE